MIDYKNVTSKQVLPTEETPLEAMFAGLGFLFCLGAMWAVVALISI
jgi:hypothetical protein